MDRTFCDSKVEAIQLFEAVDYKAKNCPQRHACFMLLKTRENYKLNYRCEFSFEASH